MFDMEMTFKGYELAQVHLFGERDIGAVERCDCTHGEACKAEHEVFDGVPEEHFWTIYGVRCNGERQALSDHDDEESALATLGCIVGFEVPRSRRMKGQMLYRVLTPGRYPAAPAPAEAACHQRHLRRAVIEPQERRNGAHFEVYYEQYNANGRCWETRHDGVNYSEQFSYEAAFEVAYQWIEEGVVRVD